MSNIYKEIEKNLKKKYFNFFFSKILKFFINSILYSITNSSPSYYYCVTFFQKIKQNKIFLFQIFFQYFMVQSLLS